MTKFIASVARRFATCADYVENLNDSMIQAQRAHAAELAAQTRRNLQEIARALDIDPNAHAESLARRDAQRHAFRTSRIERKRARSSARFQKEMLRDDVYA